jgi:hypothetical protein
MTHPPPQILRCCGNVFTELLLRNDRRTQTDPQTQACNNSSIVSCILCRGNVFTELLPCKDRRDTHTDVQSQSNVTTDGQSASPSWKKAPVWGLRPHFYHCQLRICWCGALSLMRGWICRLQLLLALASAVIFGSESNGNRDHILPSQFRDFPFRRLLRLAGLRWRYSNPPPHIRTDGRDLWSTPLGQVQVPWYTH